MALFTYEQPKPKAVLKEGEAKLRASEAKFIEAEKRTGRFLAIMLDDLRLGLRSKRERKILRQEAQKLRIKNKLSRLIWREPLW